MELTDVVVMIWHSAAASTVRRARTRLLLTAMTQVWGRDRSVMVVPALEGEREVEGHAARLRAELSCVASPDPLSAQCDEARALRKQPPARDWLRLPDELTARAQSLLPGGAVDALLVRMAGESEARVPRMVPPDPRELFPYPDPVFPADPMMGAQSSLVLLHGDPQPSRSLSRGRWRHVVDADVSSLDLEGAALRGCELAALRTSLRCLRRDSRRTSCRSGEHDPQAACALAHSTDAAVTFRSDPDQPKTLLVELHTREGLRPLASFEDTASGRTYDVIEGITEWTTPAVPSVEAVERRRRGFRVVVGLSFERRAAALLRDDAVELIARWNGKDVPADAVGVDVAARRATVRLPSAASGQLDLSFASPWVERASTSRALRVRGADVVSPGALSDCAPGRWATAEATGFVLDRRGGEICAYLPWWYDEPQAELLLRSDEHASYWVAELDDGWSFGVFWLFVVALSLLGSCVATRAPQPTHIAVRVQPEGGFRDAEQARWLTIPIGPSGPLSTRHGALSGSSVSLQRGLLRTVAVSGAPVVLQSRRGEPCASARRFAVTRGLLVLEGRSAFVFVDAKTARGLARGELDVPLPPRDASSDEGLGAVPAQDTWRERLFLPFGTAAVLSVVSVEAAVFVGTRVPWLSQRAGFAAVTCALLGGLLAAVAAFAARLRRSAVRAQADRAFDASGQGR